MDTLRVFLKAAQFYRGRLEAAVGALKADEGLAEILSLSGEKRDTRLDREFSRAQAAEGWLQSKIKAEAKDWEDFLGHSDVKTIDVYARADLTMKEEALKKAAGKSPKVELPSWKENKDLLAWLKSL